MKTKNIKFTCLITVLASLVLLLPIQQQAYSQIKGNGQVTTKKVVLDQFWEIELQTYCNVIIECGKMPMVEFTIDENLRSLIDIDVHDGKLTLSTEDWIKAKEITLRIQVPFISSFKNAGWGRISINNLSTDTFNLVATTGDVNLSGEVRKLLVRSGTGNIDALEMSAEEVYVEKSGWGKLSLNASNKIEVEGEIGRIIYSGRPEIIRKSNSKNLDILHVDESKMISKPNYVEVKIKNNSGNRKNFFIQGPQGARFSYGFPMGAGTSRDEKVPVGTKIWEQNKIDRTLLIEISEDDAGSTLDLFDRKKKRL